MENINKDEIVEAKVEAITLDAEESNPTDNTAKKTNDAKCDEDIKNALLGIQETNGIKIHTVNKRVDFDKKTMKRLETMMPVYSEELDASATQGEIFAYVVKKAIDSLFEGDFKSKIDEL